MNIQRSFHLIFTLAAELAATNFKSPLYTTGDTDIIDGYVIENKYSDVSELSCAMRCNHDQYCDLFGVRFDTQEQTNKECFIFKRMSDTSTESAINEQYQDMTFYKQQGTTDNNLKTKYLPSITEFLSSTKYASHGKLGVPSNTTSSTTSEMVSALTHDIAEVPTVTYIASVIADATSKHKDIILGSVSKRSNLHSNSIKRLSRKMVARNTILMETDLDNNGIGSSTFSSDTKKYNYQSRSARLKPSSESSISVRSSSNAFLEYATLRTCSESETLSLISDEFSVTSSSFGIQAGNPSVNIVNKAKTITFTRSHFECNSKFLSGFSPSTSARIHPTILLSGSLTGIKQSGLDNFETKVVLSSQVIRVSSLIYTSVLTRSLSIGMAIALEFLSKKSIPSAYLDSQNHLPRLLMTSSPIDVDESLSTRTDGSLDTVTIANDYKLPCTRSLTSGFRASLKNFGHSNNFLNTNFSVGSNVLTTNVYPTNPLSTVISSAKKEIIKNGAAADDDVDDDDEDDDDDDDEGDDDKK